MDDKTTLKILENQQKGIELLERRVAALEAQLRQDAERLPKVVQIISDEGTLVALDSAGRLWGRSIYPAGTTWRCYPGPQLTEADHG